MQGGGHSCGNGPERLVGLNRRCNSLRRFIWANGSHANESNLDCSQSRLDLEHPLGSPQSLQPCRSWETGMNLCSRRPAQALVPQICWGGRASRLGRDGSLLVQAREAVALGRVRRAVRVCQCLAPWPHDRVLATQATVERSLKLCAQSQLSQAVGLLLGEHNALGRQGFVFHAVEAGCNFMDLGLDRVRCVRRLYCRRKRRRSHAICAEADRSTVL